MTGQNIQYPYLVWPVDHLEQFFYKLKCVEPDETDVENPSNKNQQSQVIRSAALSHTKLKIF